MLLPNESGKAQVVTWCTGCHSLERIVPRGRSRDAWYGTAMLMGDQYGAQIPEEDVTIIVEYLSRFFGEDNPITEVPMNVNRIPAEVLRRLEFLSPQDVETIDQFRAKRKFESLGQVQELLDLDSVKFDLVQTYLKVM